VPWHSVAGAEAARHKVRARERFRDAGLPVPWFAALQPGGDPRALDSPFPCVVKPVVLAASRGVIRADNERELVAAVERVRRMLGAPDVRAMRDPDAGTVLIEGFIPGQEFAVDGVLDHGTLHVLAIFDKPDPLDGPFFEETIYVTPSRAPAADQSAMHEAVAARAARSAWAMGPSMPSAASPPEGYMCSKWRRGRSVACAPAHCGSRGTAASPSHSRSCCCGTRRGFRGSRGRARRQPQA
jgi:biotin carboxylase